MHASGSTTFLVCLRAERNVDESKRKFSNSREFSSVVWFENLHKFTHFFSQRQPPEVRINTENCMENVFKTMIIMLLCLVEEKIAKLERIASSQLLLFMEINALNMNLY